MDQTALNCVQFILCGWIRHVLAWMKLDGIEEKLTMERGALMKYVSLCGDPHQKYPVQRRQVQYHNN